MYLIQEVHPDELWPLRWTSMEQVQYEAGSIEEGIYESQIIGA